MLEDAEQLGLDALNGPVNVSALEVELGLVVAQVVAEELLPVVFEQHFSQHVVHCLTLARKFAQVMLPSNKIGAVQMAGIDRIPGPVAEDLLHEDELGFLEQDSLGQSCKDDSKNENLHLIVNVSGIIMSP